MESLLGPLTATHVDVVHDKRLFSDVRAAFTRTQSVLGHRDLHASNNSARTGIAAEFAKVRVLWILHGAGSFVFVANPSATITPIIWS